MNETRTINLNGLVYHIDYDAYKCLQDYLSDIEQRLPQQDRQEVMADLEARIAELFQKALSTVHLAFKEIFEVLFPLILQRCRHVIRTNLTSRILQRRKCY